ncbi:helix-turn-helix domain-containing protein [Acutalibacter caecimuris]|uniref:helix-turn-helix domain-containing protein n=1 Tax=Acutalibacter caecimuris TaxID=3093657 RepID=UPI002AC8C0F5|nr:helix-turn-helix transcriptional regulator [Acutalibacter sp. M00118]
MKIGERIRYFRTGKGYSTNKLANLAGVSQSYLRDIELGHRNPTIEFLSLLCDTLGITLREFFDDQPADPLLAKIYRLTPAQRKALGDFLDALAQQEGPGGFPPC